MIYRDMKVYNCPRHGLLSHDWNSGNLTVSRVEFTWIGGTYARENVKLFYVNSVCERMRFILHGRILTTKPHSPITGLTIQRGEGIRIIRGLL